MDDKQLQKLVKKNAAKAAKLSKARDGRQFDKTLPKPPEDADIERTKFFKEMKRREFSAAEGAIWRRYRALLASLEREILTLPRRTLGF